MNQQNLKNSSPVQQGYFRSPPPGVYKGGKTKYYYQTGLEEFGLEPVENDCQGAMNTLAVGSHDKMGITAPRKNIREADNKTFRISFEAGNVPFEADNEHVESSAWTVCSNATEHNAIINTRFDTVQYNDSRFCNPTDDSPMKASLFLSFHVMPETVKQILYSRYKNLEHYHKNIEAMLKTSVYQRIRRIRCYSRVERHLKDYDFDAELLGFMKKENNQRNIPDRKTIGHFENTRLGIEGMQEIRDAYVIALRDELAKYGYVLGEKISIDSTPLTALSKDPEARYNMHYERLMYKVHIVVDVDTNVPLFVIITTGTEFDGKYLISILEKMQSLGMHPKKIYADEHYDTLENWAVASFKYGVKCQINLAENAVFRDDGKPESLQKEYQRFHRNADFKSQDKISFDEMLDYLLEHEKYECVGAYFRNQWYLEWKKRKMELECSGELEKKPRSKSEGLHGHIKENMLFEVFMDGRGMKYAEKHANMIIISLLVVALTRVQNGVLDGITRIACLT
jgi:hypothetical protein